MYSADIQKLPRQYLPADFTLTDWSSLAPFFEELDARPLLSLDQLEQWLRDVSELESVISEDACWRQIRMTCDTENKSLEESFNFFMLEIQPQIQPWSDRLNRKLIACPFISSLDTTTYFTFLRSIRKQIDLFRESNIPVIAELNVLAMTLLLIFNISYYIKVYECQT